MKIGANSFLWTDSFGVENLDILHRIAAAGLDGIEIGLLNPNEFPAGKVRSELESLGLSCTTCSVLPPGASLIAANEATRRKGEEHIVRCLEVTAEAGGQIICGPLYAPVGTFSGVRCSEDEWKRAIECWHVLAQRAGELNVEVAIEPLNRFETYFLNTVADAVRLCDEINHPSVGY